MRPNILPARWLQIGLCLVALSMLFASHPANADTRIFDDIAMQYKNASGGWMTVMLGYANRLFMLLATIELAWSFATWALDKKEFDSLISTIIKKIMWVSMFYALLLNGSRWVPAIIDSFVDAGASAGGSAGLSPTEVFNTGINNAATMVGGMSTLDILRDPVMMIFGGLASLIMVLAFSVIAGQLLIALVEGYVAVSAGLLFLGFGGSRWTVDFVQKFIGYAVATGIKLFMLYLIIGIGNAQAGTWAAQLTAALGAPGGDKFQVILTVMGGSVVLMYLAIQTPALAASMLAGSPTLTAGGAAATGGAVGAGVVGTGAAVASATIGAAKVAGGVIRAAGAGASATGRQVITTLGNTGNNTGNTSSVGEALKSSAPSPSLGGSTARAAKNAVSSHTPPSLSGSVTPPAPNSPPVVAPGGAAKSTATASSPASAANSISSAAPASVPAQASAQKGPSLQDRLNDLRQVQPPPIPSDAAPPATFSIRLDAPHD